MSEATHLSTDTTISHLVALLGAGEALLPSGIRCGSCDHTHSLNRVGSLVEQPWSAWFVCGCGCTSNVVGVKNLVDEPCCDFTTTHHHHVAVQFPERDGACTICAGDLSAGFSISGTAPRVNQPGMAKSVTDTARDVGRKLLDDCIPHDCQCHTGPPCDIPCDNSRHYNEVGVHC